MSKPHVDYICNGEVHRPPGQVEDEPILYMWMKVARKRGSNQLAKGRRLFMYFIQNELYPDITDG